MFHKPKARMFSLAKPPQWRYLHWSYMLLSCTHGYQVVLLQNLTLGAVITLLPLATEEYVQNPTNGIKKSEQETRLYISHFNIYHILYLM